MAKTTKQARPPVKVSPPAPAPITTHDVWRFSNSEDAQASNALVGGTIADTLESCAWVLAFLSEFHVRKPCREMNESAEAGLVLVVDWVLDAITKQSKQLEVDHG
jgi:hypothetical protein